LVAAPELDLHRSRLERGLSRDFPAERDRAGVEQKCAPDQAFACVSGGILSPKIHLTWSDLEGRI